MADREDVYIETRSGRRVATVRADRSASFSDLRDTAQGYLRSERYDRGLWPRYQIRQGSRIVQAA